MSAFEAAAGYDRQSWDRRPAAVHAADGLVSKRIVVGYGFWIFLLSDIIMFSAFFATYAVLVGATAGGPSGRELFNLRNVGIETACLLLSSFTCGLASIGAWAHRGCWFYSAMAATCILGAAFLFIEVHEFVGMVARGAGPTRSAFLSAFFTLVGCHVCQRIPGRYSQACPVLRPVLAYPRYHLGRDIHRGVFDGSRAMSHFEQEGDSHYADTAPGYERFDEHEPAEAFVSYLVGLGLATLLTIVSFFISGTTLVWGPSIPVALVVLAIAQMGVHLVFFLNITTGPDNVNNVMALAFGVLIVFLVIVGSLWIMAHLNHNMVPMDQIMQMQR